MEYLFAISSLLSGSFCIFLEKEWFSKIDDMLKVPLYGLMGSSISFIIIYALIDIMEFLKEIFSMASG